MKVNLRQCNPIIFRGTRRRLVFKSKVTDEGGTESHKDTYQFQVLWRGIDRSEDNPSWEPWANESLRTSEPFVQYCQRTDVRADLGADFVAEPGVSSSSKKRKQ